MRIGWRNIRNRQSSTAASGPTSKQSGSGARAALGHAQPRTYEELRAVLASGTVHFPKRLRQVAIFLWQHPGEVAVGTISQVAEQAGVQPSTLVRFAQAFGYAGFSDFQRLFKEHVHGAWPEGRRARAPPTPRRLHFLHGLVAASQASLARVGDGVDAAAFERAAALLAAADLIYVIGSKRAFPVTAYVSLSLSQQGVKNVLVDNVGSTALDQVGCIGAARRRPRGQLQPLQLDHPRPRRHGPRPRRRLAAITDSAFSPLVPLADACDRGRRVRFRRLPLARRLARRRHGARPRPSSPDASCRCPRLTGGHIPFHVGENRNIVPGRSRVGRPRRRQGRARHRRRTGHRPRHRRHPRRLRRRRPAPDRPQRRGRRGRRRRRSPPPAPPPPSSPPTSPIPTPPAASSPPRSTASAGSTSSPTPPAPPTAPPSSTRRPTTWDRLLAVNARAPFFLMQGAIRAMRARGDGGAIVNIASINAHCGAPDLAVYSASKAALANMTKNAANAHRFDRIRVNGINVGWTLTPTEQALQDRRPRPRLARRRQRRLALRPAVRAAGDRQPRRLPAQRRRRPDDRRPRRPGAVGRRRQPMTLRLSPATLDRLPPAVRRPGYDRAALGVGMAHVGVGAFHRCHQAEFTDDMLEARFGPLGHRRDQHPPAGPRPDPRRPGRPLHPRPPRAASAREARVIGCHLRKRRQPGRARAGPRRPRRPRRRGRHHHRHREGLLPPPRRRRPRRGQPRHPPRPRRPGRAAEPARPHRRGPRPPPRHPRPAADAHQLRQHPRQRRDPRRRRAAPSPRRVRASPTGSPPTPPFPRPWSTASSPRRRPPTSPPSKPPTATTTPPSSAASLSASG